MKGYSQISQSKVFIKHRGVTPTMNACNILLCILLTVRLESVVTSLDSADVTDGDHPVRETEYGHVRGRVSDRISGQFVEEYLGIPYAAPPIGNLRLKHSTHPGKWTDTLNTTEVPPACLQDEGLYYVRLHQPLFDKDNQNESCLFLNIYVPRTDAADYPLPVLFHVHGGSNRAGTGAMYTGDLLAYHGTIVVVTVNYRLGPLGFLALRSQGIVGNYGLVDLVNALKWVQRNIHNFGGNPGEVTLAGHSAGAGNVGLLMVSPLTKGMLLVKVSLLRLLTLERNVSIRTSEGILMKLGRDKVLKDTYPTCPVLFRIRREMDPGLFRYVIVESGSPLAWWNLPRSTIQEGDNLDAGNIPYLTSANLMSLTEREMLKFMEILETGLPSSVVPLTAVIDNFFLKEKPVETFSRGNFTGQSVMLTMTGDEGFPEHQTYLKAQLRKSIPAYAAFYPNVCNFTELVLKEYEGPEREGRKVLDAEGDIIFFSSIIQLADIISRQTNEVSLFQFDFWSPSSPGPEWQGIPHGRDMFYIFGLPLVGVQGYNFTDMDVTASKLTMTLWSNFVKYGFLTLDEKEELHRYGGNEAGIYHTLYFDGKNITIGKRQHFRKEKMKFWNEYIPSIKKCSDKNIDSFNLSLTLHVITFLSISKFVFANIIYMFVVLYIVE